MRRKNDKHEPELEGIAQRLRHERPEASPLELDQIKTTVMSRARATASRANPRRLVVAALTVGLMAAGTGGVLAAGGSGGSAGNAAQAQYSTTGNVCGNENGNGNGSHNGNGNGKGNGEGNGNENGNGNGNESGNQNGNFNCNTNSFNGNTVNSNNVVNNVTNNYNTSSTVTVTGSATAGVLGTSSKKAKTSSRKVKIHIRLPRKAHLRKVKISVNGKHLKTLTGRSATANVTLVNLPCGNGSTTVQITVVLSNGKTVTESHHYNLCTA
ncbi:MAG TPA: hypothetical protein VID29_06435 [Solirubrobacteraceae bacterium]|jgi:hypothetical protein